MILLMLILAPLLEGLVKIRILMDAFFSVILLSGIYAVSQKKQYAFIAFFLAIPAIASAWTAYFVSSNPLEMVGLICGMLFYGFTLAIILSTIYGQGEVELDIIIGAAVVYLFLALMWASLYRILEMVHPGSFSMPEIQGGQEQLPLIYYSFVTITTLGYGDITPLTPVAQSLSVLEAVVGQLYIAVQVAWLVGVHVSQSMKRRADSG